MKAATSLALSVAFMAYALPVCAAERVALVIGNNGYAGGRLPALDNCVADSRLVARALEGVGFRVIAGENLDKTGMDTKLAEFEDALKPGDEAVFYFAGHGIEFEWKNYLIGTNAKLEQRSRLGEEALNAEICGSITFLYREISPWSGKGDGVRLSGGVAMKPFPARCLGR